MRKSISRYILVSFVFILVMSFFRSWFSIDNVFLWLGALVGSLLPDIDSFIYVWYINSQELTSQRVKKFFSERQFRSGIGLLYNTKDERQKLFFHSVLFQVIFIVFAYYVISSTGNQFGRGLVISFLVHLLLDQYIDLKKNGSLGNWFHNLDFHLSHRQGKIYLYFMFIILLLLGLVV